MIFSIPNIVLINIHYEIIMDIKENTSSSFLSKLNNNLICPITHHIFLEPVMVSSGITYEKIAIVRWLQNNKTCPMSRKEIDNRIYESVVMKDLVTEFLKEYPEELMNQYKISDIDKFFTMCYNYKQQNLSLENISYDDFLLFIKQIESYYMVDDNYYKLFWNNDNLKKLVDTIHNFQYKELLLCLILSFGDSEILQYILDHHIDINVKYSDSNLYPIHHLITSSNEIHTKDSSIIRKEFSDMQITRDGIITVIHPWSTPMLLEDYLYCDHELYRKLALLISNKKIDFDLKTSEGISLIDYVLKLDNDHKFRVMDILFIHSNQYTHLVGADELHLLNYILNNGSEEMRDMIIINILLSVINLLKYYSR